ncbi:MAG: allantoinase [Naasia sp.]|jgi:allantoinase|uniref:dihydroorotase n=1 Tax=Naasia sp. TaxID=2546198 RepID=UPI00262F2E2C|nr:dihydroorotase family protein [Naasia sp.]MCU1570175.1 allantoinase [Naasia sp.]
MRLLIKNGSVVTPDGVLEQDILCEDGRIAALLERGHNAQADETVDVSGKLVFPGFIDPHVHSRDPGMTEKEDFAHSTLGALVGGVTTILEMPNAIPPVDSVEVLRQRKEQHEGVAWVDFGLWGIAIGDSNIDELGPMFEAGAAAIKIFWGYALRKDTKQLVYNLGDEPPENLILPPDNGAVLRVFEAVAAAGGLLAAHCEDRDILAASQEDLGHPIETYEDLLAARPAVAEATSIAVGAQFAKATGCRFHVVHMASAAGADVVREAQDLGLPVTAETCPQYLSLTDSDYERVGPMMKVYPPIRSAEDRDALWEAVNDGTIVSIGSDHAPHTVKEKSQGLATQPAGGVGCETFGPVMLDRMFAGDTTPERFADVMSTSTAKLYGLYPRKGAILPGSDADLTIVDPGATWTVRNEELVAKQPTSAWNGFELTGMPTMVILRGEVAMKDRKPVGEHRGRFVPARHNAG